MIKNICLSMLFLLCSVSCACAEMKNFGFVSVNIPDDWTAKQQSSSIVAIRSNNTGSSLTIASGSKGEESIEVIAKRLCGQLKGFDFEDGGDGDYFFDYKDAFGTEHSVYVFELEKEDDEYFIWSDCSENEDDRKAINEMIRTSKFNFPDDKHHDR